jgi:hypothetical protein
MPESPLDLRKWLEKGRSLFEHLDRDKLADLSLMMNEFLASLHARRSRDSALLGG